MKSDKIQSLFATKLETYATVEGQPSDPELSTLWETLTALLLTIAYDGEKGIHNLVGLIMNEDAYKSRHGAKFSTPSCPAIYDNDIPIDASNAVRVRRGAAHITKKEDYRLFAAAKRESSKFILTVVEYTWVHKLRDPDLFYTAVKPRDLLKHLQAIIATAQKKIDDGQTLGEISIDCILHLRSRSTRGWKYSYVFPGTNLKVFLLPNY